MTETRGDIAELGLRFGGSSRLIADGWMRQIRAELVDNILPFWTNHAIDRENGGFFGLIDTHGVPAKTSHRSCVLNTRILWTFSRALRLFGYVYRETADRACAYVLDKFWDREYGGLFWMLDHQGSPVSTRKQIYAQAFGLYGLAEYHRATGNRMALDRSMQLFALIEEHGRDRQLGGYFEAFGRDWGALEDMRLSERDMNCPKSMNTLLHVLEAYTSLFEVTHDPQVGESLTKLLEVFITHVVDDSACHLKLFFDERWNSLSNHISYGHDIEASWLLVEAAAVLGDRQLMARTSEVAVTLAQAVLHHGVGADGGMAFEADSEHAIIDPNRHWWVQAEAVVGFFNAYKISGDERLLEAALGVWTYIDGRVADRTHGEWHAKISPDGRPVTEREDPEINLVGPWKCPYHNSRVCFEMLQRLQGI